MSKEKLEQSFKILKKTVPLLIKHKMPPVPTNYAIWYTYAANDTPALNERLDQILDQVNNISPVRAEQLYQDHIADKQEVSPWQLRKTLEAMVIEMSQTMKDTRTDTNGFRNSMDGCLDDLAKVEKEGLSVDEVMNLVRNLVKDAQQIRRSTQAFSAALSSAEKEIADLRAELQKTQQHALHDSLTGLCNRRFFDAELSSLIDQESLSLIIVDVDHFKRFNDEHGHVMGDKVLKGVGKKLQQSCRDGLQAYRYGGEEFAIIAPNVNLRRACHLADVMRRNIEKIQIIDKKSGNTIGGITASFGVATTTEGMLPKALVEEADKQLYDAKKLGRNRVLPIY